MAPKVLKGSKSGVTVTSKAAVTHILHDQICIPNCGLEF